MNVLWKEPNMDGTIAALFTGVLIQGMQQHLLSSRIRRTDGQTPKLSCDDTFPRDIARILKGATTNSWPYQLQRTEQGTRIRRINSEHYYRCINIGEGMLVRRRVIDGINRRAAANVINDIDPPDFTSAVVLMIHYLTLDCSSAAAGEDTPVMLLDDLSLSICSHLC